MGQCYRSLRPSAAVGLVWACCLAGCQQAPPRPTPAGSVLSAGPEPARVPDARQVADVQVALARVQERHGEVGLAQASYLEALKHDASRADACERLGVLCDRQGKLAESREWYEKARAARGPNPDLLCNLGYSQYLQCHWTEAESNLRQAIALDPGHCRAHNNLGLVLAQTGQEEEALTEFRNAGCSEAEARANLAFALTLRRCWPQARAQYEKALAADPSSLRARQGLQQVTALMAKADPTSSLARNDVSHLPAEIQPVSFSPRASLGTPPPGTAEYLGMDGQGHLGPARPSVANQSQPGGETPEKTRYPQR